MHNTARFDWRRKLERASMDHLLGCGAGPLSPRRARATSGQIVSQASAFAGAFRVGETGSGPFAWGNRVRLTGRPQPWPTAFTCPGGELLVMRTLRMDIAGTPDRGPAPLPRSRCSSRFRRTLVVSPPG
jgi:hypothetical protein